MSALVGIGGAWCLGLLVVTLRAALGVATRGRRSAADARSEARLAAAATPVLILRPCSGDEPHLATTLGSTAAAARPGDRVRFAIAAREDGALPKAYAARDACRVRGVDSEVVVTGALGPNVKVDQLARVLAQAPSDWEVAIAVDSDVRLTREARDTLVAAALEPSVGAAWLPPVEVVPETRGDRASAAVLDASLHAFVLLADIDGGGMVGKALAIRRRALEAAGGFANLRLYLGEDVELGRRLRATGWRVKAAPAVAASLATGRTGRQVVARLARWITVVRGQRPWLLPSYPLIFAATPLLLCLAAVAIARGEEGAPRLLAAALALRLLAAWVAGVASVPANAPRRRLRLVDLIWADSLLLVAFVQALAGGRMLWRGRELRLKSGLLVQSPEEARP